MSEREDAASYWAGRKLGAFSRPRPWSEALAAVAKAYEPARVFEFGCNVGRHLRAMREAIPEVQVAGMDIHLPAVHVARSEGLPVLLGDELSLSLFEESAFDVAYTVSVLDHLPSPAQALYELDRIAEVVIFAEPWMGYEGKVSQVDGKPANRFLYSWDYAKRLPRRSWRTEPFPLHDHGAGPHYRLHIGER